MKIYDPASDGLLDATAVRAAEDQRVTVTWSDGVTREVDLADWLAGHPLLEELRDPVLFSQVRLVEFGGGIEWPNGADFCAQALRIRADEQYAGRMAAAEQGGTDAKNTASRVVDAGERSCRRAAIRRGRAEAA